MNWLIWKDDGQNLAPVRGLFQFTSDDHRVVGDLYHHKVEQKAVKVNTCWEVWLSTHLFY